jgi:hypothetical protein
VDTIALLPDTLAVIEQAVLEQFVIAHPEHAHGITQRREDF